MFSEELKEATITQLSGVLVDVKNYNLHSVDTSKCNKILSIAFHSFSSKFFIYFFIVHRTKGTF